MGPGSPLSPSLPAAPAEPGGPCRRPEGVTTATLGRGTRWQRDAVLPRDPPAMRQPKQGWWLRDSPVDQQDQKHQKDLVHQESPVQGKGHL